MRVAFESGIGMLPVDRPASGMYDGLPVRRSRTVNFDRLEVRHTKRRASHEEQFDKQNGI